MSYWTDDEKKSQSGQGLLAFCLLTVAAAILIGSAIISGAVSDLKRSQRRYSMNAQGLVLDSYTGRLSLLNKRLPYAPMKREEGGRYTAMLESSQLATSSPSQ